MLRFDVRHAVRGDRLIGQCASLFCESDRCFIISRTATLPHAILMLRDVRRGEDTNPHVIEYVNRHQRDSCSRSTCSNACFRPS